MKNDRTEITTFDLTKTYDKEIAPLVKKLENMCLKYEIPVFITCCVKSTKDETFYKNTIPTFITSLSSFTDVKQPSSNL